jgi:hypothetical protein
LNKLNLNYLKYFLNYKILLIKVLDRFGLRIIKRNNHHDNHFIKCEYSNLIEAALSYKDKSFLIEANIEDIINLHANSFSLGAVKNLSPWTIAAKHSLNGNDELGFESLKNFYENWVPKNAFDYYGFEENSSKSNLKKYKPFEVPLPWIEANIDTYGKTHKESIRMELLSYGIDPKNASGWGACGPAEDEKIRLEYNRLRQTVISISKNGYIRESKTDGDIEVACLIKSFKEKPKFLIRVGGHRVSALDALGYKKVLIRIDQSKFPFIIKNYSKFWPQVVNGTYSQKEAEELFDRMFRGNQQPKLLNSYFLKI